MARSSAARAEVPRQEKPKGAKAKEQGPAPARKEKPPRREAVERGNVIDFMGVRAEVAEIAETAQGNIYFLEAKEPGAEVERVWFVSESELWAGKTAQPPKLEKVKPLPDQPEVATQLREATKEELRQAEDALIRLRAEREEIRERMAAHPKDRIAPAALKRLSERAWAEEKRWHQAFVSLNPDVNSEYAFRVAAELTGNGILLDAEAAGLTTSEKIQEKISQLTSLVKKYAVDSVSTLITQEIEKLKTLVQGFKTTPEMVKIAIEAIRDPKTPVERRRNPSYLKLWAKWSALPESDQSVFLEFVKGMVEDTPEGRIYEQFAKDRREIAEAPAEKAFANAGIAIELGITPAGLEELRQDFEEHRLQTIVGFTWEQFMNPTVEAPKGFFGKLFRKTETVQEKREKMLDAIWETGARIKPKKKAA